MLAMKKLALSVLVSWLTSTHREVNQFLPGDEGGDVVPDDWWQKEQAEYWQSQVWKKQMEEQEAEDQQQQQQQDWSQQQQHHYSPEEWAQWYSEWHGWAGEGFLAGEQPNHSLKKTQCLFPISCIQHPSKFLEPPPLFPAYMHVTLHPEVRMRMMLWMSLLPRSSDLLHQPAHRQLMCCWSIGEMRSIRCQASSLVFASGLTQGLRCMLAKTWWP